MRIPFALRDDNTRVILPHPGEASTAHDATGLTISELRKANRIGVLLLRICPTCSELLGATDEDDHSCPKCGNTDMIILESAEQSKGLAPCDQCADGKLHLTVRGVC